MRFCRRIQVEYEDTRSLPAAQSLIDLDIPESAPLVSQIGTILVLLGSEVDGLCLLQLSKDPSSHTSSPQKPAPSFATGIYRTRSFARCTGLGVSPGAQSAKAHQFRLGARGQTRLKGTPVKRLAHLNIAAQPANAPDFCCWTFHHSAQGVH